MGLWHGVEFYENEKLVGEREFLRPKVRNQYIIRAVLGYTRLSIKESNIFTEVLKSRIHLYKAEPSRNKIFLAEGEVN